MYNFTIMKEILIIGTEKSQIIPLLKFLEDERMKDFSFTTLTYDESLKKYSNEEFSKFDFVISDTRTTSPIKNKKFIKLNVNQKLINLTHGIWIKEPNKHLFKKNGKTDVILSMCPYSDDQYKKMGFSDEEIIKGIFPRIDFYKSLDKNLISSQVRNHFNIGNEKKLVLFAPSWISSSATLGRTKFNLDSIIKSLSSDEELIVSPHFLTMKNGKLEFYSKKKKKFHIVNESEINNEFLKGEILMNISSKVITDYSSVVLDFAYLYGKKNVVYYKPNKDRSQPFRTRLGYFFQYFFWGNKDFRKNSKTIPDSFIFDEREIGYEAIIKYILKFN